MGQLRGTTKCAIKRQKNRHYLTKIYLVTILSKPTNFNENKYYVYLVIKL